jgi:hypothetical protein
MPYRENEGKSSSRRDDLEGLGLMMIKFLRGYKGKKFPWEAQKPEWPEHPTRDAFYYDVLEKQDREKL